MSRNIRYLSLFAIFSLMILVAYNNLLSETDTAGVTTPCDANMPSSAEDCYLGNDRNSLTVSVDKKPFADGEKTDGEKTDDTTNSKSLEETPYVTNQTTMTSARIDVSAEMNQDVSVNSDPGAFNYSKMEMNPGNINALPEADNPGPIRKAMMYDTP